MRTITKISINLFVISLAFFGVSFILIEVEKNYDCGDDLDCQTIHEELLQGLYRLNVILAVAVIIGTILLIVVSFPNTNGDDSNCQKCGKDYGWGFIYLPRKEWNVKETKVCKSCFKEMESQHI